MAMKNWEARDVFAVNSHFLQSISRIQGIMDRLPLEFQVQVSVIAERLCTLITAMIDDDECAAFVGDADMAKNWKTMFEDNNTVSGSHLSVCS